MGNAYTAAKSNQHPIIDAHNECVNKKGDIDYKEEKVEYIQTYLKYLCSGDFFLSLANK